MEEVVEDAVSSVVVRGLTPLQQLQVGSRLVQEALRRDPGLMQEADSLSELMELGVTLQSVLESTLGSVHA